MLFNDPEAPTTITRTVRLRDPHRRPGDRFGRRSTKARSSRSTRVRLRRRPRRPRPRRLRSRRRQPPSGDAPTYPAAGPVPKKQASNFLIVDPTRSATGNTLAVMGPQLGYYYPEIVRADPSQRPRHRGAGRRPFRARRCTSSSAGPRTTRGASRPRTTTCATCSSSSSATPTAPPPTRASDHYLFQGTCRPFETFNAGTLNGTPIVYPQSVHGPVIGTATSDGQPVALTRQRSTFGRDGLNLAALKDMTDGKATTPGTLLRRPPTSSASRSTGATSRGPTPRTSRPASCRSARPVSTAGCPRSAPATTSGAGSSASGSTRTASGAPTAFC